MRTSFSELLKAIHYQGQSASLQIPEDWMQGRSTFGGLQAVLALQAARTCVPATLPLRVLQATFIGPVAGEVQAQARVLRSGKNVVHVQVELQAEGQILASLILVFGAPRESQVRHLPPQPVVERAPDPARLPDVAGITPNFCQHFDARWIRGGLPFSGNPLPEFVVEVALRDSGNASEAHLLAFADYVPPVAFSQLRRPSAGSSLTWMLELFGENYSQLPVAGWRVDAELLAARDGYTSQACTIWDPNGALAALSQQSMVVFS